MRRAFRPPGTRDIRLIADLWTEDIVIGLSIGCLISFISLKEETTTRILRFTKKLAHIDIICVLSSFLCAIIVGRFDSRVVAVVDSANQ